MKLQPRADLEHQLKECRRELAEALEQQTATSEVLRVISTSPTDVQSVFEMIVRRAVTLCGSLFANVFRFDGELLHFVAGHNVGPSYVELLRAKYPMRPDASQVAGRVLLTKSVVQLEDALADPDYDQRFPHAMGMGWRRMLGVPMLRHSDPLGVIVVGWAEPGSVSNVHEGVLKQFADQAVIALENVRLFKAEQQRTRELYEALEQQTATSEVLRVISSSPGDLQPVFSTMLENALRICEAKFGVLFHIDDEGTYPVAMLNLPPAFDNYLRQRERRKPKPGSDLDILCKSRQVIHTIDMLETSSAAPPAKLGGARTQLAVPMLKDGGLVGAIVIYRQEVRAFTEKQIDLVKNFAAQAVIAIENMRLLNELRQRTDDLSEALEQQTATSEVLSVISTTTGNLRPVFDKLLANATRLCGAKFGMLKLYDGDSFRTVAFHNAPPAYVEARSERPFRPHPDSGLGYVERTRQIAHIEDVRARQVYLEGDPVVVALADLAGARTLLIVPMLRENELVGTIGIYRQEVRPFADKQIELVKNFAAQAVIAIENARLVNELRDRTDDLTESLQQQTATADVLKVISRSTFDLQAVLDILV